MFLLRNTSLAARKFTAWTFVIQGDAKLVFKFHQPKPYSVWVCIDDDGSILTGECGGVAGLISSCKHVFVILHYIENQVTLGHNKTCTRRKQKWDVRV